MVAGAAILFWAFTQTDEGSGVIDDVENAVGKLPSGVRGIRNNNPGNIRRNAIAWQGLSANQTDSAFFQFDAMEYGIRAIGKILMTYQDKYGLNSVQALVSRWAPSIENDTTAYVNAVASDVGVNPDDQIDVHDRDTMFAIIRGIISHENGAIAAALISDDTVSTGVDLALNS